MVLCVVLGIRSYQCYWIKNCKRLQKKDSHWLNWFWNNTNLSFLKRYQSIWLSIFSKPDKSMRLLLLLPGKIRVSPAGNYMFKVNNRNTRTRYEICSKLSIKISERHQWRRSGIFIVNFEHISHFVQVFLLLILNM